jgi:hypothetical protein
MGRENTPVSSQASPRKHISCLGPQVRVLPIVSFFFVALSLVICFICPDTQRIISALLPSRQALLYSQPIPTIGLWSELDCLRQPRQSVKMSSPFSQNIPMPAGFLSLAPTTSASYPLAQKPKRAPTAATSETAALPLTTTALAQVAAEVADATKLRTSSLSSDGSKSGAGLRFLKLGPVHQGEHLDGSRGDWHELAVE